MNSKDQKRPSSAATQARPALILEPFGFPLLLFLALPALFSSQPILTGLGKHYQEKRGSISPSSTPGYHCPSLQITISFSFFLSLFLMYYLFFSFLLSINLLLDLITSFIFYFLFCDVFISTSILLFFFLFLSLCLFCCPLSNF